MRYTKDHAAVIDRIARPKIGPNKRFTMDIVEYDEGMYFLMIRFYQSEWDRLEELERGRCAEYLAKVQQALHSMGFQATLDPIAGRP